MSQLNALKTATTLADIAKLLNSEASGLAYVLYKVPEALKYKEFDVPKRYGGTRKISAPSDALRLLQQRLSNLLQNCLKEIEESGGRRHDVSHGFKRGRSIMSNGESHRRKRYVFNVDLKDFFPSINFGRVRGFFIKDKNFLLSPKAATFLAQIACYKNALPQGSPCSPVISNLVSHVLDTHLVRLAAKEGCRYTRYADDLTFSTNKTEFPKSIAKRTDGAPHDWIPGAALVKLVEKSGFAINPSKTRMQYHDSRQEVTGLVVNRKVNVRSDYRRTVRQMTHRLMTKGNFESVHKMVNSDGTKSVTKIPGTVPGLHGMLAFIDQIDLYNLKQVEKGLADSDKVKERIKLATKESVYRRFLLFSQFYAAPKPIVLCEGSTDNVYLVHAIRSLVADLPTLATKLPSGEIEINVRFYRYFKRRKKKLANEHSKAISSTGRILDLKGGSGELLKFAKVYKTHLAKITAPGAYQPVILLIDNDKGANDMFGYIKGVTQIKEPKNEPFVHLLRNLYVVPTPLTPDKPNATMIEDFFSDDWKKTLVEGKPFNPEKDHEDHTCYGKVIFAHRVVRPNAEKIDFSQFKQLLLNISSVIESHRKTHPPPGKAS
ncbi:MAG: RNA-directed DNA polymerase [Burkholderiales bacterium]|nr:RNA-directed DNA polymerase [Burkholderiales bacterium]